MNRFGYIIVVFFTTILTNINNAPGVGAEAEDGIILILDLRDGSHIIGSPAISSIGIQTAYAKMEIPLKQIQNIKLTDDHETALFELTNEDRLKGALILGNLELQTLFGKVTVAIEHIMKISVCRVTSGSLPIALKDSLVFHYSFDKDEGNKVTDMAGNNDGVVQGAKWTARGKVGGAMEFSGKADHVDSLKPVGIEGAMQRTLAAWIHCNVNPPQRTSVPVPVGFGEANSYANPSLSGTLFSLALYDVNNTKNYCFGMWGVNAGDVWSNLPVTTGIWYHVVATFDGETVSVYVNGKMNASKKVFLNTHPSRVFFSRIWGDYHDRVPFQGIIDEVMIFNRALSDSEVNQLYDAQK
ncbi:MAG: LamG domain-containing protein [Lentisphaerae bacterium]|nr:LamG domain-containing protein [Lentisphaerota bacterium]